MADAHAPAQHTEVRLHVDLLPKGDYRHQRPQNRRVIHLDEYAPLFQKEASAEEGPARNLP